MNHRAAFTSDEILHHRLHAWRSNLHGESLRRMPSFSYWVWATNKKNTNTLLSGIQCSEILSFNPISTFISFQNQYFRLQVILTLYLTVDGLSCFCVNLCFFQSGDASLRNYSICAWNHSRICVTLTLLGISSRFRSQFFPPHLWAAKEQKIEQIEAISSEYNIIKYILSTHTYTLAWMCKWSQN